MPVDLNIIQTKLDAAKASAVAVFQAQQALNEAKISDKEADDDLLATVQAQLNPPAPGASGSPTPAQ